MSSRLLFTGVSTMRDHAGQHKLYFIADALGRRGVPVSVLVPDREENRAFLADKPHVDAHFYTPGGVASDLRHKARMLTRNEWSAVWVVGVGLRSLTLRGWWAPGVPIVKDFDEFPSMIESFGPMRRAYLRWIERRMIRQADGFTCASAFLESTVRRQRPKLRRRVLRLPVAISAAEHQVRPELVARLNAAAGGRSVLVYVGSLNRFYEDQIDEILRLAAVLQRRGTHATIRILGGGPDAAYFQRKSARAELAATVEWAGHVERADLASHMDAADVLIFPFPSTPFNVSRCPTKAFHYAAAGRPVVTNRTGEVAALFGEAALYYPEHDIEALADRCEEALRWKGQRGGAVTLHDLTWDARAATLQTWLGEQGWLPRQPATRAVAAVGTR